VGGESIRGIKALSHISPVVQRLRITFGKSGALQYTSNLDTAKIWERVLRRAGLPILYTQGFNTRPRIQLAMPLPLGITSECEILDIALRESIACDDADLSDRLLRVSPQGLSIHAIEEVDLREGSLQSRIIGAEYRIHFVDQLAAGALQHRISDILQRESIVVEKVRKRRRSVMDLRPLINELRVDDRGDLIAFLSVGERGNMRPDQLIEQMGLSDRHHHVHRFKMHFLPK
jgi:radical SAM-linked protein